MPLTNRVHDFYTRNRTPGRPKGLDAEHGTCEPFYCSMILLHNLIEILGVTDDNSGFVCLVVPLDRGRVGPTPVDGDLLREPLSTNGLP